MTTPPRALIFFLTCLAIGSSLPAQTSAPASTNTPDATVARTNTAIVAVQRPEGAARRRTDVVIQRAKDNPGECDIVFIGDSITEGWENRAITNVWRKYYGSRKALNFGVGGDRTQHVLWRFERHLCEQIECRTQPLIGKTQILRRIPYGCGACHVYINRCP